MVIILYCKTYIAIIIAIYILFVIFSPLVQSQEFHDNEKPDSNGDVIFMERSEGDFSRGEKVQVFIGDDNGSRVIMKSGESGNVKVELKEPGNNNDFERKNSQERNESG